MKKSKKNILVLGIGQSNFLNQLYGEILKRNDNFNINIDVLTHLPNDQHNQASSIFQESLNFDQYLTRFTKWQKIKITIKNLKKYFYKKIFIYKMIKKK